MHLAESNHGPEAPPMPQTVQGEQAPGDQIADTLRMLMGVLMRGKINMETYKISLLALTGKQPRAQNGKRTGVLYTKKSSVFGRQDLSPSTGPTDVSEPGA
jgi:hypothetical protein